MRAPCLRLPSCREAAVTDRLSASDRAMLMGGACAKAYNWSLVSLGKLGAWFLLMILSYTLVAMVSGVKALPRAVTQQPQIAEPETTL